MLQIKNYSKSYGENKVLNEVNFHIKPGEIVTLLGPNGCGKSTLLKSIAGFIDFEGLIKSSTDNISYIGQDPKEMLLPWKNIKQNLIFPEKKEKDSILIEEILKIIKLENHVHKYPYELSGGMEQLLLMGRALINDSNLILLDEPFKSLDYFTSLNIRNSLLEMWNQKKPTIFLVSHDINDALLLSHKIILLNDNPTKVKKIIDIDIEHNKRDILSNELLKIKEEILNEFR